MALKPFKDFLRKSCGGLLKSVKGCFRSDDSLQLHQDFPFMTCVVKVNTKSTEWASTVKTVLKNVNGVTSFRMDEGGTLEISGTVDPNVLLKMFDSVGKDAELCWFQFGECSSNLYMPTNYQPQMPLDHNKYYYNYPYDPNYGYGYGDRMNYNNYYDNNMYNGYGYRDNFRYIS